MGTVEISSTVTGITGILELTVLPASATLESIAIEPDGANLLVGKSAQLSATGTYTDGSIADITALVIWTVNDGTILQIGQDGMAAGLRAGSTSVQAGMERYLCTDLGHRFASALVTYFSDSATSPSASMLRISGGGAADPDTCAMLYVFNQDQQMAECCGCPFQLTGSVRCHFMTISYRIR